MPGLVDVILTMSAKKATYHLVWKYTTGKRPKKVSFPVKAHPETFVCAFWAENHFVEAMCSFGCYFAMHGLEWVLAHHKRRNFNTFIIFYKYNFRRLIPLHFWLIRREHLVRKIFFLKLLLQPKGHYQKGLVEFRQQVGSEAR